MATLPPSVERFEGFADVYDQYRPRVPDAIVDLLCAVAQVPRPALVVDVGSGTGLSTRVWAGRAERVIGVEPSGDMRRRAEAATSAPNISYREGHSHDTHLPDACADIVTCSQSLHWMEPESAFREAARILRPGGVMAAIDCDWPPTLPDWRAEAAYESFQRNVHELEKEHGVSRELQRWEKAGHLGRMRASGRFRHTSEVLAHGCEPGNAGRLVGLALSQGGAESLLKAGLSEAKIGLDRLREAARDWLGDEMRPWHFSYRVRIGVV
jgi:ubiquinone/menaquinone biosynthesis C-methylase UbiE